MVLKANALGGSVERLTYGFKQAPALFLIRVSSRIDSVIYQNPKLLFEALSSRTKKPMPLEPCSQGQIAGGDGHTALSPAYLNCKPHGMLINSWGALRIGPGSLGPVPGCASKSRYSLDACLRSCDLHWNVASEAKGPAFRTRVLLPLPGVAAGKGPRLKRSQPKLNQKHSASSP